MTEYAPYGLMIAGIALIQLGRILWRDAMRARRR